MTLEALRAADMLAKEGIAAEIIDLRTVSPPDDALILKSVRKTGRLIVADTGCKSFGSSAEVVAKVAEEALGHLKSPPIRVSLLDCPAPTAPALASQYYPLPVHLVRAAKKILGLSAAPSSSSIEFPEPLDVPDLTFAGPF
jgi:pyruvate dehydrogenase E1 component beta subunit